MKTNKSIKSVFRSTLNQKVYENLKKAILSNDLPPGTKLNEMQVAKQLNVSPTPVREAFRMLSAEGLVKTEPWKGVFVQKYSSDEARDVYQCREVLECFALCLWHEKNNGQIPKIVIEKLEELLEASHNSSSVTEVMRINSLIHDQWIVHCGNRKLGQLLRFLNDVLLHDRNISANTQDRRSRIEREHREIIEALRNNDIALAEEKLREHIRNGYEFSRNINVNAEKAGKQQ